MRREIDAGNQWLTIRLAVAIVVTVCVVLFVIRLTGPSNLTDNDQERPGAYVVDVVENGQWLVQRDHRLDVMSKPPVYTWMAAVISLGVGEVNLWTLYLPCLISSLSLCLIILFVGRHYFGLMAGFLGALTLVLSPIGMKQIALARTDSVFALTVIFVFLAAWWAWNYGKSWIPFWLAAAVTTLTKGPLGILLGSAGLLMAIRARPQHRGSRVWLGHLAGIVAFILIAGGWFLLAWLDSGQALIDKMIGRELLGHTTIGDGEESGFFGAHLVKPTLYFLSRFVPWSLLTVVGLWRVFRSPAENPNERQFEIYTACFFLFGVGLFSLFQHQRPDLLYPLIPAAALLAGRELALLAANRPARVVFSSVAAVIVLSLGFAVYEYHVRLAKKSYVRRAEHIRAFAEELDARVGKDFPLIHVDSRYTLQFFLETMRPRVGRRLAAEALNSDYPAFVVVTDQDEIDQNLIEDPSQLHEVMRWPQDGKTEYVVVSNRPRIEKTSDGVFAVPGLLIEMEGARFVGWTGNALEVELVGDGGKVVVTNTGDRDQAFQFRIRDREGGVREQVEVSPQQAFVWQK